MPPKPIDDIDFPDLSTKILELLYALWEFVCDIGLVLSSSLSHTFCAVWTYPPFETFRNELAAALVALWHYVVAHVVTSVAICVLAYVAFDVVTVGFSRCLGLRRRGVLRASYAASYRSTGYGGNVPRGSRFARFQSLGA